MLSLFCSWIFRLLFPKKSWMYIKGWDNTTHHPHHNLDWDIPPGVSQVSLTYGVLMDGALWGVCTDLPQSLVIWW